MSNIAVITGDPVSERMAGPAIRAWNIAVVLSRAGHRVRLASTQHADAQGKGFEVLTAHEPQLRDLEAWCDVLVFQGGLLHSFPFMLSSNKVMVADIYDPFHLENFEGTRGQPTPQRFATVARLTTVLNEQLLRGDFFLCASERQRDFWLGSLAALGRVNPATYDDDPQLRNLIDVAPFGVESDPPVRRRPALRGAVDAIGPDDEIVLWAGGVYDWFDPLTLVRAVDRLRHERPKLRLVFLGLGHPHPDIPRMKMADAVVALANDLDLVDRHVFFTGDWIAYSDRVDFLLEANLGVSCHLDHLETAFSFRTRLLDYLWAGLPVVATGGDTLGELIEREGAGVTVVPGDPHALARAMAAMLDNPPSRASVRAVARQFEWDRALSPLVTFCRAPRRAPDAGIVARSGPSAADSIADSPTDRSVVTKWRWRRSGG